MKIGLLLILHGIWWIGPTLSLALTVEEIVQLKQNGVSETTIQMMLQSELAAQEKYGGHGADTMGIRTITRPDGQPAIVYSTGRGDHDARDEAERRKEEQAWEMLRNIILDMGGVDAR